MRDDLLDIRDLRTYFYTSTGVLRAVDGVNLRIGEKEAVGLVGESGCGKTMTAFSVMRLVPRPGKIVDGEIRLRGRNMLKFTEAEMRKVRGKDVSMVFQDPATFLNPVMKIKDQILEAIYLHEESKNPDQVIRQLKDVRMPSPSEVANYYPHMLSGGMRQRVIIAIALSCNPSLLIADEPTTALDVTVQAQIMNLMSDLIREHGTSLLLITHDLGIVAELCERVYVMYAGKIVESADVFELFEKALHPYTQGLLKCVLSIDEFKEELVTIEGTVPSLINPPSGCRFHPRCTQARTICRQQEPSFIEIEPRHYLACWSTDKR